MLRILSIVVFLAVVSPAVSAGVPKSPAKQFQGIWLFDKAAFRKRSELGRVWKSVVSVNGDSFTLSNLMGSKTTLKGTLVFDAARPGNVDLKLTELDLSAFLTGYKLPAGTLQGRYTFNGSQLTLCFPNQYTGKRPTIFVANDQQYLATLVRASRDFKEFPKEVAVTVIGADGKPASAASVSEFMSWLDGENRKESRRWIFRDARNCDARGTVVIPTENIRTGQLIARGAAKDTMGFASLSPARLATGQVRVELLPQVRLSGSLTCEELTRAGQPIGWAGGYLLRDGSPVAFYSSKDGKFEFLAPPGRYTLNMYGSAVDGRYVEITVPENRNEYTVEPIAMKPLAFALLKGKPAPELKGVVGWKGKELRFADLKGKYVLVEFWGYWCGPCVGSMPVLIELHEKFADKGLAIVGVHMDIDGEVNTAEKLDAKLVKIKKQLWKGKEMPFPSALVPGTRVGSGDEKRPGGAIAQYGIRGFPTTILIDRDGRILGEFHARDIQDASAEIKKLLAKEK